MIRKLLTDTISDVRRLADDIAPLAVPRAGEPTPSRLPFIREFGTFNDRAQGFADELPWNIKYDAQTLLTRDQAFTSTFRIRAKTDLSWAPTAEKNRVAERLNQVLREMHQGWIIQDHLCRGAINRYPDAEFPDPASWCANEERKKRFLSGQHYTTDIFRTFTYLPPRADKAKLDRVLYVYDRNAPDASQHASKAALEAFRGGIDRMIAVLADDFDFEPLTLREATIGKQGIIVDDQLSFYKRLLTGSEQPIRAVKDLEIISELLGDNLTRLTDGVLRLGDTLIRPVTVLEYPGATKPDILEQLELMPGNFTVCWRWLGREPERAQKHIRSLRGRNLQKRESATDSVINNPDALQDPEAVRGANDAEDAFGESRSGQVAFGYFTLSVLAYEPVGDDLRAAHAKVTDLAAKVMGRLKAAGFLVSSDHDNELEVLLGCMPADGRHNVVRGMMSSRNLANLLPSTTLWTGDWVNPDTEFHGKNAPPLAIFAAHGTTPFAFNLHASGLNRAGHTLLAGESGDGKTTLAGWIADQHRKYAGSQQIIVDSEFQHYVHVRAVGGRHVILAQDSDEGLSPFAGSDPDDRPFKVQLMGMMLQEQGLNPADHAELIFRAILALERAEPKDQCVTGLMSAPGVTQRVRQALDVYSRTGVAGSTIDNPPKPIPDVGMHVFETSGLRGLKNVQTVVLAALDMEINRLCRRRSPTLIVSEEMWELLRHPVGATMFLEGLKLKRRMGATYLLLTQSLADIDDSSISKQILGACATKIVMPNENAIGEFAERYARLGLQPWERQALADHVGQRAAYIIQPRGRRMIDTSLGPVALAVVGQSSGRALERFEKIEAQFPEDWLAEMIFLQFDPTRSREREAIAESWRRHLYFYPRRNDERELPVAAPKHPVPHPSDPFGPHIDAEAREQIRAAS